MQIIHQIVDRIRSVEYAFVRSCGDAPDSPVIPPESVTPSGILLMETVAAVLEAKAAHSVVRRVVSSVAAYVERDPLLWKAEFKCGPFVLIYMTTNPAGGVVINATGWAEPEFRASFTAEDVTAAKNRVIELIARAYLDSLPDTFFLQGEK